MLLRLEKPQEWMKYNYGVDRLQSSDLIGASRIEGFGTVFQWGKALLLVISIKNKELSESRFPVSALS
jgi:hypothetical protein